MAKINLSQLQKIHLLGQIQAFLDQHDTDSQLDAQALLAFFSNKVADVFYEQGVADSQLLIAHKLQSLDSATALGKRKEQEEKKEQSWH